MSIRRTKERIFVLFLASFISQQIYSCGDTNEIWESMEKSRIKLYSDSGQDHEVLVKLALNAPQRKSGFQHVCGELIDQWGILFVFPSKVRTTFHMRNVEESLGLIFFRKDGKMIGLKIMHPENQHRANYFYRVRHKFRYALEISTNKMRALGLDKDQWSLVLDSDWHKKRVQ